jgi:hypothetical protein
MGAHEIELNMSKRENFGGGMPESSVGNPAPGYFRSCRDILSKAEKIEGIYQVPVEISWPFQTERLE